MSNFKIDWKIGKERINTDKIFHCLDTLGREKALDYLIEIGMEITVYTGPSCVDNFVTLIKNDPKDSPFSVILSHYDEDIRSLYLSWKSKVRKLLEINKDRYFDAYELFVETDSVPYLSVDRSVFFPYDTEGLKWFPDINSETRNKLQILRNVRKETGYNSDAYIVNKDGVYFAGETEIQFDKATLIYLLFDYLYNKEDNFAKYKDINRYFVQNGRGSAKNKTSISERVRNVVKSYYKEKSHPKKVKNKDTIEVIARKGIKLNIR